MESDTNWVSLLVNWLPMLVILGAWIYVMRSMTGGGGGMSYGKYLEQHLAETRRHNELLEKILQSLSDKPRTE